MFDLGWTELLVIGIVALIVVGPKDLPVLFRSVGRFMGKARGMAREFSSAMHDAAEQSGVNDVAKGLKAASNPMASAMDEVKDVSRDLTDSLNPAKLDPAKYDPTSEIGKLASERAQSAKRIEAASARAAADRLTREAEEARAKAAQYEADLAGKPESES